jgi:hypothetical protein
MNIDFPQSFLDSVLLSTFLEVKAPDVHHKDAFWHDENDETIDCNIYHPKYGTITVNNKHGEFVVKLGSIVDYTSSNFISEYSHRSRCPTTGKTILCRFKPLPVLCLNEDGTYTNKDGKVVIKVDWLQTNIKRPALDINDFSEIYQREFIRSGLLDTPSSHETLKETLTSHVHHLIKLHQDDRVYGSTLDLPRIAKAREFISWMPGYTMPPVIIDGILFNDALVLKVHKHYNNVIFNSISESQLFDALNYPEEYGSFIKMKDRQQGKLTGLIRRLEDICKSKEWTERLLLMIPEIEPSYYSKQSAEKKNLIKLD